MTVYTSSGSAARSPMPLLVWLPIIAGLCALYVPSLIDLFRGIWSTDEQKHGPIVLAVACWLAYRNWPQMRSVSEGEPTSVIGWPICVFGLLLYIVGRSQEIPIFEICSTIWLLIGIILLILGNAALKAQWFALFFLIFMVPLPGTLVDAVTMPMKMSVSYVAEDILFWMGYPIARAGVILQIGQYQLLVSEACAGLHTLFTLEAMGLLYLNLVRHDSLFRNVALAMLIVPISLLANAIRVMALTLITYHFGDDAGRGFLHGFSGMVLFVSALILIMAVDSVVRFGVRAPKLPK